NKGKDSHKKTREEAPEVPQNEAYNRYLSQMQNAPYSAPQQKKNVWTPPNHLQGNALQSKLSTNIGSTNEEFGYTFQEKLHNEQQNNCCCNNDKHADYPEPNANEHGGVGLAYRSPVLTSVLEMPFLGKGARWGKFNIQQSNEEVKGGIYIISKKGAVPIEIDEYIKTQPNDNFVQAYQLLTRTTRGKDMLTMYKCSDKAFKTQKVGESCDCKEDIYIYLEGGEGIDEKINPFIENPAYSLPIAKNIKNIINGNLFQFGDFQATETKRIFELSATQEQVRAMFEGFHKIKVINPAANRCFSFIAFRKELVSSPNSFVSALYHGSFTPDDKRIGLIILAEVLFHEMYCHISYKAAEGAGKTKTSPKHRHANITHPEYYRGDNPSRDRNSRYNDIMKQLEEASVCEVK
ncbi:MAG: hypothetical protein ACKVTZ_09510, partial [Bacteroidia bacterium]